MSVQYAVHTGNTYRPKNTPFHPFWQFEYADPRDADADLTKESFKELNNKPALMWLSWSLGSGLDTSHDPSAEASI